MIQLGIDIGVTGAIAAIDVQGRCKVVDLPTIKLAGKGMVKQRLDPVGLMRALRALVPPGECAMCVIENVHTMPGSANSPQSGGSLMHSRGIVEAVLALARVDTRPVEPVSWKKWYGLGKDKNASREIAMRLFPDLQPELKRVRDHNRAESVLLANYCARVFA